MAQGYAPRPETNLMMYVVVGIGLAIIALALFGQFYEIEVASHPAWYAPFIILISVVAILLWFVRRHRHNKAHRAEYDRTEPEKFLD